MYQLYRDRPMLVLAIVLANIVLSSWCIYMDPVINNDGVTYLAIADLFNQGRWAQAFEYYSWPYYSLFIAGVSQALSIEVESAAHLLNTFFVTSLTLAFVCIVADLSNNNRRIILIAVVVVLLFPSISKYRSFMIRDFGYLSCYLWSLFFIFRYCSSQQKQHLAGWLLFAVLSCLFRFEGIAFLLIAPYFLLLFNAQRMPHRKAILGGLSVAIISLSSVLLYWYLNDKYNAMMEVARLNGENIHSLSDLFFANLEDRFGPDVNYLSVFATNLFEVAYELIRRMAIFYFVFALIAYARDWALTTPLLKRVWLVFVVTNLLVLTVFSLYNNFLVSRYTMATALTLLILAPFAINKLWLALRSRNMLARSGIVFAFFLLGLASANGLNIDTDKHYLKNAGRWLDHNVPTDAKLYSNNKLVVHYSGLDQIGTLTQLYSDQLTWQFIESNQIITFDYIALDASPHNKMQDIIRQTLAYKFGLPVKIFDGEEQSAVYIFNTKRPD